MLFLNNIIPEAPLPENSGVNERLVWLKTGYLVSGISKTPRSAVNPAG
jgi:hypothetical protein